MQCNRKIGMLASLGFGVVCAVLALETPAPETPLAGRAARGAGGIINGVVDALGPNGAAWTFLAMGVVLAAVSAAVCPSGKS